MILKKLNVSKGRKSWNFSWTGGAADPVVIFVVTITEFKQNSVLIRHQVSFQTQTSS